MQQHDGVASTHLSIGNCFVQHLDLTYLHGYLQLVVSCDLSP